MEDLMKRRIEWVSGNSFDYPVVHETDIHGNEIYREYKFISLKTPTGLWTDLRAIKPYKDQRYKRFGRRNWIPDNIDFYSIDAQGKRTSISIDCLEDEMPLKTVDYLILKDRNLKNLKRGKDTWL
tara:strand:+ start:278 stop:652 length:375 start_codon:yes stop_codon:yes gene_type:complete